STARLFLFAWLGVFLNAILLNSSNLRLIPNYPLENIGSYISITLLVVLLSLSLADQINMLMTRAVRNERALHASERRFRHLYERAPVGIAIADPAGNLEQANRAYQNLLGYDEAELKNLPYLELINPQERAASRDNFQQLVQGVQPAYEGEVQYLRKDGSLIWIMRSVSALLNEDGEIEHTFAMIQDIHVRKKQETELRHYSEHLEESVIERTFELERSQKQLAILNRASQTINIAGLDRERVYTAIRAACAWLVPADVVAISLVDHAAGEVDVVFLMDGGSRLPESRYALEGSCVAEALEIGATVIVDDFQDRPCWPWSPPDVRSGMAVMLHGSTGILGTLNVQSNVPNAFSEADRTALESFAAHVSITLENIRHYKQLERAAVINERQRLASELHDSVTQLLYSMAMISGGWGLKASQDQLPNPADHFYQIEELSLQALKEMRVLIHQMRLPVLAEIGLLEALEDRLDKVERRLQLDAHLHVEGSFPKISAVVEDEIYFIVLEALNNSLHHARATVVRVDIWMQGDKLHISVEDNGRGYDPSLLSGGMGTANLNNRAAAIGARLKRNSHPGQGTRVELVVEI
ncbi:MAG: PAS domain S-box protein, partial [Anaerolineae bacterium]|nr:PAS domain S-box protein [Anaerolineae bacterium]